MYGKKAFLHIIFCVVVVFIQFFAAVANGAKDNTVIKKGSSAEFCVWYDPAQGNVQLTNGRLVLNVDTSRGLNANHLYDVKTERVYADQDYIWPQESFPRLICEPELIERESGELSVSFRARLGNLIIAQRFWTPAKQPGVIFEQITICNPGDQLIDTSKFVCGFAKKIEDGNEMRYGQFCPIPFRSYVGRGLCEYSVSTFTGEFVEPEITTYVPGWKSSSWGAEGWAWSLGQNALLISKYNTEDMEWSLLQTFAREIKDPQKTTPQKMTVLRFGGAGLWKLGDPEKAASLKPKQTFTFGITRFETLDGGWKEAYYAHRRYAESKGVKIPKGYNPPVHWNELMDNQSFFKVTSGPYQNPKFIKETLNIYYRLEDMKIEAAKAQELGCESLYLDPGWDTGPTHFVWDSKRLGSFEEFQQMLSKEYGIRHVGLWCGLAHAPPGYSDPEVYAPDAIRKDVNENPITYLWQSGPVKEHKRLGLICSYAPAFHDVKLRQLLELADKGANFLMYDGTQYTGPCYDPTHGHSLPLTRYEHTIGYYELVQKVKAKHPEILIEMHDPVAGPTDKRYTPVYFYYAHPAEFELWGYEYMWNSMDDLLRGAAYMLYYTNLAYNIPIYLHVNLKADNANALVFWYYASTCRHLGVGGKHSDPNVWQAHKDAMKTYLRLKPFFTQGEFYGVDELTHIHTLRDKNAAVINCFNVQKEPLVKHLRFKLSDVGLSSSGSYRITGAYSWQQDGDIIDITLQMSALSASVIELVPGRSGQDK
jgi:hypothetical protein